MNIKTLSIFFLTLISICVGSSQETSGFAKKDFIMGVNSTISGARVADAAVNPSVGYFLSDQFLVGGSGYYASSDGNNYSWIGGVFRYYPSGLDLNPAVHTFFEGTLGLSPDESDTNYGVGVGVNAFIWQIFYLESKLKLSIANQQDQDLTTLGLDIGFGFRFNK